MAPTPSPTQEQGLNFATPQSAIEEKGSRTYFGIRLLHILIGYAGAVSVSLMIGITTWAHRRQNNSGQASLSMPQSAALYAMYNINMGPSPFTADNPMIQSNGK